MSRDKLAPSDTSPLTPILKPIVKCLLLLHVQQWQLSFLSCGHDNIAPATNGERTWECYTSKANRQFSTRGWPPCQPRGRSYIELRHRVRQAAQLTLPCVQLPQMRTAVTSYTPALEVFSCIGNWTLSYDCSLPKARLGSSYDALLHHWAGCTQEAKLASQASLVGNMLASKRSPAAAHRQWSGPPGLLQLPGVM